MKIERALPHPAFGPLLPLSEKGEGQTKQPPPASCAGEGGRRPDEGVH
jgi:hypothetical protein